MTLAPTETTPPPPSFTILADASDLASLGENSGFIIMWPANTVAANSTATSSAIAASSTPAAAVGGMVPGGSNTPYRDVSFGSAGIGLQ